MTLPRIKTPPFLYLMFLTLVFFPTTLGAEEEGQAPSFNLRLQRAYRATVSGDLERGRVIFEDFLRDNPKEWLIYDFYANALKYRGDYDGAIKVYERALTYNHEMKPIREDQIRRRIETIQFPQKFEQEIEQIPPFDQANTFGTQQIVIKTNLLQQYYLPIVQKTAALYRQEKKVLEGVL